MKINDKKRKVAVLYSQIFKKTISTNWIGFDIIEPLINKIKNDGCIIIIEFRPKTSCYLTTIMNDELLNTAIESYSRVFEESLSDSIIIYNDLVWKN